MKFKTEFNEFMNKVYPNISPETDPAAWEDIKAVFYAGGLTALQCSIDLAEFDDDQAEDELIKLIDEVGKGANRTIKNITKAIKDE